jgi:hypothetical protein
LNGSQCKASSITTEQKSNANKKPKDNKRRRFGLPGAKILARDSIKQMRDNLVNDEARLANETYEGGPNLPNNNKDK